jgi:hypothetical protein
MTLRPSKRTREKRTEAPDKAASRHGPIGEATKDASLVRALSEIVNENSSAKAKLAQIESLIAKPGRPPALSRKKGNNPSTDDHPVRSLQGKIEREFKHTPGESPNSVAASISVGQNRTVYVDSVASDIEDFERELDSLLATHGVKSKKVRGVLARAFGRLAERAKRDQNIGPAIAKLDKLIAAETAESDVVLLPDKAPLHWRTQRELLDSPISFIRRVYGKWLGHGLTQGIIGQLDPTLYRQLLRWLKTNEMPKDIDLPTREDINDRRIALLNETGSLEVPGLDDAERLKELQRLVAAMRRRIEL